MSGAFESKAYDKASDSDKVLFILYDEPEITKKHLSSRMYPVPSVPSVHKTGTEETEGTRVQRDNLVKVSLRRHKERGLVVMNASNVPPTYSLTPEGESHVRTILQREENLEEQRRRAEAAREEIESITYKGLSVTERVKYFEEYFTDYAPGVVSEAQEKGLGFLNLDVALLSTFCPELAEDLLEDADQTMETAIHACKVLDLPASLHLVNLPQSSLTSVREIRSEHISKLISCDVEVESVSETRPYVTKITYECPSCGNVIPLIQDDDRAKKPGMCACGRKSGFKVLSKQRMDEVLVTFSQPLAELFGDASVRSRIKASIRGSLANPQYTKYLSPGRLLRIAAIVKEKQVLMKHGGEACREELLLMVHGLEPLEKFDFDLEFTPEEEEYFREQSGEEFFLDYFADSLFPKHYGDVEIKKAIALQLLAGNFRERRAEQNLHILIVGDPGTGKTSNLLRPAVSVAPLGRFVEATKSTKAGLVGSASSKDRHTEQRIFEPGALPRAHRGLVAVDELTALPEDDPKALNEAMASGVCSFDKANVHLSIPSDVRVLAAMNPPNGRFDDYTTSQDALSSLEGSVRDRFGLIYFLRDRPSQARDEAVATAILEGRGVDPRYSGEWCKRFITYVRHHIEPVLRKEEADIIKKYYVTIRAQKIFPVGPRYLESLASLTRLAAKARLSNRTSQEDLKTAASIIEPMRLTFALPKIEVGGI